MSIEGVNNQKPVKVTKTGENTYKYEYADGTIKCVFADKNSVTYNKNDNKDIQLKTDWSGDLSVFNGKNLQVEMGQSCTGITLEKCKDSNINARHLSINSINLKDCTNLTVSADKEDIITSNDKKIKVENYEPIKINDKAYNKARMLNNKDADPQDRAKIYDEQLFGGQSFSNIKIEGGMYSSGHPIGGVSYKKASFPNGDTVIRTEEGQYIEYNKNNNAGIKISSSLGQGINIKNANGATIISTKMGNGGILENSVNCTYSSMNMGSPNRFETLNCKNTTLETDNRDEIRIDGKKLEPNYGTKVIKE